MINIWFTAIVMVDSMMANDDFELWCIEIMIANDDQRCFIWLMIVSDH